MDKVDQQNNIIAFLDVDKKIELFIWKMIPHMSS